MAIGRVFHGNLLNTNTSCSGLLSICYLVVKNGQKDMSGEDNSWVFDSLVAFLNGPIWDAPLQSFIEEKSLIFEPNGTHSEDHKKIFEEFKNLVDFMLGNFMEDIGISPEQFQDACAEGKRHHASYDNNLFEQIWAANDFEMFTRMMTQRNVELQLQALALIEKKYGITPQSFVPQRREDMATAEGGVVKMIPVTVERESKLEKEILEEVAKRFNEEQATSSAEIVIEDLMEHKPILEQTLRNTLKEVVEVKEESKKPQEIDSLDLKKRQEYLKAQRDKLVALKKEARQKHLATDVGTATKKNRPKSAKAAEAVLTGEKSNIEASQLQIRKTLAERLRTEVVDKDQK